jgi:hypothetical protein
MVTDGSNVRGYSIKTGRVFEVLVFRAPNNSESCADSVSKMKKMMCWCFHTVQCVRI